MSRIQWTNGDGKSRGVKAGEIVMFSNGSYSEYIVTRAVLALRDISAEEMESAADGLDVKQTHPERNGDKYDYIYEGEWIERLISFGALQDMKVCEIHTETKFRYEGGPAIVVCLSEH